METWGGRAIQLHKGEVWRFENDLRGLSVACTDGILWITQEGDLKDYILEAGKRYVIARRGSVVVQALSDARLRIVPPLELSQARSDRVATHRD